MIDHIRIMLIDDHALFRESLVRLLGAEPDFQVVAHCATVAEARRLLNGTAVDVVLLDYDLGEELGTDLLQELRTRKGVRVLMVTAGMTDNVTLAALNTGLAGIIFKHSGPGQLIEAIHRVANGEMWLETGVMRSLIAGSNEKPESARDARSLTGRQRLVLLSILDGCTNKEIASQLRSSETSIKAIIQELFNKAGVRTRSQLVRIATEKYSSDWLKNEEH